MDWYIKILPYVPFLLAGLRWTILMSVGAMLGGIVVGLLCEWARSSRWVVLRIVVKFYIDVFRSIPPLIQLLTIFYALPVLTGVSLGGVTAGLLGMSLYAGAYLAEIFRAGFASVPKGQSEAASALGMAKSTALRRIIMPQAFRNILPTMTNSMIVIVKDSSLLSFVSVTDLLRNGQVVMSVTQRTMEPLVVVGILYLAVTAPIAGLAYYFERRRRVRR